MNSQAHKWNSDAAKAQVKERQDQVAAAIKKVVKATHTPGPWKANGPIVKARFKTICDCRDDWRPGADPDADVDINEANARLIAAAPELLEALEAARDCILQFAPIKAREQHAAGWDVDSLVDTIESAIAKARGEK